MMNNEYPSYGDVNSIYNDISNNSMVPFNFKKQYRKNILNKEFFMLDDK